MPMLCIGYCYRDANNFKRYGQQYLLNPANVPADTVEESIAHCFRNLQVWPDIVHFDPVPLGWPTLNFSGSNDAAADMLWHELDGVWVVNDVHEGVEICGEAESLLLLLGKITEGKANHG